MNIYRVKKKLLNVCSAAHSTTGKGKVSHTELSPIVRDDSYFCMSVAVLRACLISADHNPVWFSVVNILDVCYCRVVHVIELSSAVYGHHSDDMLPNVLVNLSSRSRTSSIRHVVLVLKAQSPVHWHISIQRLHCSLDVIVSTDIFSFLCPILSYVTASIFLQLYLKLAVSHSFSRSIFQVFFGHLLALWPCGAHCRGNAVVTPQHLSKQAPFLLSTTPSAVILFG